MKKLLFLLPVLAFLLLGCPPFEDTYRVYYHSPDKTAGKVPVDTKAYKAEETVTVKGQGTLKNKDYNFLGWQPLGYYPTSGVLKSGDKITINWEDINLFAVWDDGEDSPFTFEVKDDGVTITGLELDLYFSGIVVIPDTLQGKNVTAIDDTAFSNSSITEVKLSKHLKRIGVGAFAGNKIESIIIPDTVEYIGPGAFRDNPLRGVNLGTGLTALELQTFYNNELINIVIPQNITTVKTGAFAKNDIVFIRLGANVDIQGDAAFGTHGDEFRTFYNNKGKTAGLYQYNDTAGTWE
jgi:hypothetical protein